MQAKSNPTETRISNRRVRYSKPKHYEFVCTDTQTCRPYDQAVQSHAKVECLILATQMQIRLPRELRDLCYSYIWDEEYLQNTQERMVNSLSGKDFPHYGPKPHVIDPK
jgi:hypothetical protein